MDSQTYLNNYEIALKPGKCHKVLSLFSGCGGMDLGFEGGFIVHRKSVANANWIQEINSDDWVRLHQTSFQTVFSNDILPEARAAWIHHFAKLGYDSEQICHSQSVVDLVKMQRAGANVFPTGIDIVTGGFPCQDFSVAGKRRGFHSDRDHNCRHIEGEIVTEETRGKLYIWMKEVIEIVRPKIFIAENVKGLTNLGDVKTIIQTDFSSAAGNGYLVLPPQILHAADFGVPQSRERVIFIGIRRDCLTADALQNLTKPNIPEAYNPYPKITHNYHQKDANLADFQTLRNVFVALKEPMFSNDLSQKFYSKAKFMGKHCQGQNEVNLDNIGPTIRSEHHGNIEFRRLTKEHGGRYFDELKIGLPERRLTPRECAQIQTFPPNYEFVFYKSNSSRFAVSPSGAYKIIGNAVPPLLAYHIAKRIEEVWSLYFGEL